MTLRRRLPFRYFRRANRVIKDTDQLAIAPVQVCSRACGFSERAFVHLAAVQRYARARPVGVVRWVSDKCPRCSGDLARVCSLDTCEADILDAADSHCRSCGRPYEWALTRDRRTGRGSAQNWVRVATKITSFGNTDVFALSADIAALDVDAVVSTDDTSGSMRGDSAQAILRVAGPEVQDASREMGMFELGQAWSTEPGNLAVEHIVHVAAVTVDNVATEEVVLAATRHALAEAEGLEGVSSLGLPAIGAGTGNLALDVSARQMTTAVRDYFAATTSSKLKQVVFVLFGESNKEEFLQGARPVLDPTNDVDS